MRGEKGGGGGRKVGGEKEEGEGWEEGEGEKSYGSVGFRAALVFYHSFSRLCVSLLEAAMLERIGGQPDHNGPGGVNRLTVHQ